MIMQIPQLDYPQIRDNFLDELTRGSQGEQTSLPYISVALPQQAVLQNGLFQAIVIGGTHYKTQTAQLQSNGSLDNISSSHTGVIPQFKTEAIFLQTVHELLDPSVQIVSLNLAYPLQPFFRNGILDGKLLRPGKEHAFVGLVHKAVGETIEAYIKQKTGKIITIIVANDAACLSLAGLQKIDQRETLGGCIVGSGFNISLFISENMIVNLESANFNRFEQTETGKQIDQASMNTGRALFEKEISGLYLYQHYNLLREQFGIQAPALEDSAQLSILATKGNAQESQLAKQLFKRSASLVATQLAGIYLFKNHASPLTFVTEGSMIRKGWHYEQLVQEVLQKLGVPSGAITFLHIENSSIVGAAKLLTATEK